MAQTFSTTNAGIPSGPSGSDNLFLKVWSGEVMATYNANTVVKERHRVRTISSGKSAQFPAIGKVDASYHAPGELILGQDVNHGEKVITIDDLLVTSTFIANIEEAKNHYDVRSEYTKQMGQALAQTYDRQLFAAAVKATRAGTAGAVSDQGSAERLAIGTSPSAATIVTNLYTAAQKLDEKNVPAEDRTAFVSPEVYYALVQDTSVMNRDYGAYGGNVTDGNILKVAGLNIVKTNNLAVNHTTGTEQGKQDGSATTDYSVDASTVSALVMQAQGLGSVHLMDIASESEYQIERQGTLMVSRMACGHGVLRPECLIELDAAAS